MLCFVVSLNKFLNHWVVCDLRTLVAMQHHCRTNSTALSPLLNHHQCCMAKHISEQQWHICSRDQSSKSLLIPNILHCQICHGDIFLENMVEKNYLLRAGLYSHGTSCILTPLTYFPSYNLVTICIWYKHHSYVFYLNYWKWNLQSYMFTYIAIATNLG